MFWGLVFGFGICLDDGSQLLSAGSAADVNGCILFFMTMTSITDTVDTLIGDNLVIAISGVS